MSVQAIVWVLEFSEARLGQRLALLSIANHAKADGTGAWPSVATIAREAKMSHRQVQNVLRELVTLGELEIERNAGPRGCNFYHMPLVAQPRLPTKDTGGENIAPPQNPVEGAKYDGEGCDLQQERVQNPTDSMQDIAPEPSLKPSREPSSNTAHSDERADDDMVFQGKLLYLKRKQLGQFIKKYDCLPQADIIDILQGLDQAWEDGLSDKPPKDAAEAFMRAQKWLARKNREAFMRAKDQGSEPVSDQNLRNHAAGWAIQAAVDGVPVWSKFEDDEPYRNLIATIGKKRFVVEYIKPNWEGIRVEQTIKTITAEKTLTPEKGDAMLAVLQKGLKLGDQGLTRWWHEEAPDHSL